MENLKELQEECAKVEKLFETESDENSRISSELAEKFLRNNIRLCEFILQSDKENEQMMEELERLHQIQNIDELKKEIEFIKEMDDAKMNEIHKLHFERVQTEMDSMVPPDEDLEIDREYIEEVYPNNIRKLEESKLKAKTVWPNFDEVYDSNRDLESIKRELNEIKEKKSLLLVQYEELMKVKNEIEEIDKAEENISQEIKYLNTDLGEINEQTIKREIVTLELEVEKLSKQVDAECLNSSLESSDEESTTNQPPKKIFKNPNDFPILMNFLNKAKTPKKLEKGKSQTQESKTQEKGRKRKSSRTLFDSEPKRRETSSCIQRSSSTSSSKHLYTITPSQSQTDLSMKKSSTHSQSDSKKKSSKHLYTITPSQSQTDLSMKKSSSAKSQSSPKKKWQKRKPDDDSTDKSLSADDDDRDTESCSSETDEDEEEEDNTTKKQHRMTRSQAEELQKTVESKKKAIEQQKKVENKPQKPMSKSTLSRQPSLMSVEKKPRKISRAGERKIERKSAVTKDKSNVESPAEVNNDNIMISQSASQEQQPAIVDISNEQPAVVDISNKQPTDVEKTNEQPADVDISNEQPAVVDISNEQPTDVEKTNQQPADVEKTNEQPVDVEKTQDTDAPTSQQNSSFDSEMFDIQPTTSNHSFMNMEIGSNGSETSLNLDDLFINEVNNDVAEFDFNFDSINVSGENVPDLSLGDENNDMMDFELMFGNGSGEQNNQRDGDDFF